MGMNSIWKSFELLLLTLLISSLLAVTNSSSVLVNTKTVLRCYDHLIKNIVMISWEISLRAKTPCILAYRADTHEINGRNCSVEGKTWEYRLDYNHNLQIDPVTIDHDGHYCCVYVTPVGNFQSFYHLNVLVPPLVILSEMGNGTVMCKAIAGKPAAQISWDPEGDCVTENESHVNRTVTVKSTCTWNAFNKSSVTCIVSHLTGNKSLSIDHSSRNSKMALIIVTVSLSILVIVVFVLLKISNGCRTCKSTKPEATPEARQDELEPYASYTEKSNPLYDRTNMKISTASQSKGFGSEFQAGLTS
ncbi:cell surface glycoprotein CD200 receptor 1 isoform X2 [Macrotis lagotis]|uniref:cell surface glycoprotein CD200 receptor 1 isoform X2 n=1 Tax=Macrotis lagotis TaxID=92651 RepID=UPI003D68A178